MAEEPSKEQRQKLIREILLSHPIRTQAELVTELKKNGLRDVLQSTVSRDLLELGVLKKSGSYFLPDDTSALAPWAELIRRRARSIHRAGDNLLLLKVEPGAAHLISAEIDGQSWPQLVGTLAGEDTLLLAFDSPKDQQTILHRIQKVLKANA